MPFSGRYNSKALLYLAKAVDLAPGLPDYRRELFDFLLDSARSSSQWVTTGGGHTAQDARGRRGLRFDARAPRAREQDGRVARSPVRQARSRNPADGAPRHSGAIAVTYLTARKIASESTFGVFTRKARQLVHPIDPSGHPIPNRDYGANSKFPRDRECRASTRVLALRTLRGVDSRVAGDRRTEGPEGSLSSDGEGTAPRGAV